MDVSSLANALIEDLTNNADISTIMLKGQVLAKCLGNEDFSTWISMEQNGYVNIEKDKIPSYRIIPCGIKANVSIPYRGMYTNLDVPIDGIEDKRKVDYFTRIHITQSISEIESLTKNSSEGHLSVQLPAFAYSIINSLYPTGNVENCWQHFGPSELCAIVNAVKSKLMNFILMFCDEGSLFVNPSSLARKDVVQQVFNQTISNSIVHNGNGNINTNDTSIGVINTISSDDIDKLKQIATIISNKCQSISDEDIQDEVSNINMELEKASPSIKILRKSFRVLGGLTTGVVANGISPLVEDAIAIISSYF